MPTANPLLRWTCVIFLSASGACGTSSNKSSPSFPASAVVGRWKDRVRGAVIEIEPQGDCYRVLGLADQRGQLRKPEPIGEFCEDPSGATQFVGRHAVGGRWGTKVDSPHAWGAQGGLTVQQTGPDKLLVRYTDSRYKGGWVYERQTKR